MSDDRSKAERDAALYGTGYLLDGKYVDPAKLQVFISQDKSRAPLDRFFAWQPLGAGEYIVGTVRVRSHLTVTTNLAIYLVDVRSDEYIIQQVAAI